MKYYTFYRESNNFDDILKDINLKKVVKHKIRWDKYLQIGMDDYEKEVDKIFSYITLKYGDEIRNSLTKDYSPKPNIDYMPVRK
jgi:hypothetical protein